MKNKGMKLTGLLLVLTGLLYGQTGSGNKLSLPNSIAGLDSFFVKQMASQGYVALGACLMENKTIQWEGYYGYANLEEQIPLQKDHIFQLASLSKTMTATALMHLYDKGLISLDDDINDYMDLNVRNPHFPDKPITFRMLLTHTGSLVDVLRNGLLIPEGVEYPHGSKGDSPIPLEEMVRELFTPGGRYYSPEYFGQFEPGSQYSYSNFSFALIGYLVEQISGKNFSDYCRENIFKPLGMNQTGWFTKDLDASKIIIEYGNVSSDPDAPYKRREPYGAPSYPAGYLKTTMEDFSRFLSIFICDTNPVLKPETRAIMLEPQGIKNIPSRAYPILDMSLTWFITEINGKKYYSMNGFSGAIFTNAYFSPETHTAIIYFFTGITMKNMMGMMDITETLTGITI